jgi:hypothetical protein
MRAIVSDIRKSTQDNSIPAGSDGEPKGHLDLLIITHEHWDHLSGFVQAETEWNEIEVEALWTAWTENENDPSGLPDALKKILAKQQRALAAFADRAMDADLSEQQETVRGLMAFLSGDAPTPSRPRRLWSRRKTNIPAANLVNCTASRAPSPSPTSSVRREATNSSARSLRLRSRPRHTKLT